MKKCVFAGSFDPPTVGHKAVVENCLKIFDEVVVAVMRNTSKNCLLTIEERLDFLSRIFADNPAVKVRAFDGAAVDILKQEDTVFYVRGVRDCIDFEYEKRDFLASKKLMPEMVTLYIPAEQGQLQVSSTLVRNSITFDKEWGEYVPEEIAEDLKIIAENRKCSKDR